MRVLAIDPSLRSTGFAVLERPTSPGSKVRALEYGIIKNQAKLQQSSCLVAIYDRLAEVIHRHQPDCAAVEAVIYVQSYRTAIIMGAARGSALLAIASRGIPIYEYAPRRVKQAVVGRGGAVKDQVGFMVRALLGLTETPVADASDALAIGITHFQAQDAARNGMIKLEQV
ncbi:MAG: crossover junction endodeoxyribonuclease RuvC [Verrucomicrobiota bacterium]